MRCRTLTSSQVSDLPLADPSNSTVESPYFALILNTHIAINIRIAVLCSISRVRLLAKLSSSSAEVWYVNLV